MKANEFVRKYGWERTLKVMPKILRLTGQRNVKLISDLKHLVESHDLVKSKGGLPMVKADWLFLSDYEKSSPYWVRMKQAIEDMELC